MSDTNGKIKIHKNPDRNKQSAYKPYVPQYQVHGKEPQEYRGGVVAPGAQFTRPTTLPSDNPRARKPAMRQPYAEAAPSPLGRGRGLMPNVGNNVEHTWSSLDGEIVDDISGMTVDPNHPMVDNNDYMSDESMGFQNGATAADIQPPPVYGKVSFEEEPAIQSGLQETFVSSSKRNTESSDDLLFILNDLENDTFLLIVDGVPVCSGPKEEIQDQAQALVFGEHEMCDGNPIPIDDIIILKRVKVKVGLFLE